MKLNLLAFGAHPDDVEMSAGGTIIKHIAKGWSAGIIDLTQGELGTRGNAQLRNEEANAASKILGVQHRSNLRMRDGFIFNNEENQIRIIEQIRKFKPDVLLANAPDDRHIDHGRAAELVKHAAFLSGLRKIETVCEGEIQEAWRPKAVHHYIQDKDLEPTFLIDISNEFEQRMNAVMAYKSQFHESTSNEPQTYISTPEFMEALKGRFLLWGKRIGVKYAEGFISNKTIGVNGFDVLS